MAASGSAPPAPDGSPPLSS
ncbi:hypothetical protein, partial [Microbacterium sp. MAH-37]